MNTSLNPFSIADETAEVFSPFGCRRRRDFRSGDVTADTMTELSGLNGGERNWEEGWSEVLKEMKLDDKMFTIVEA